VPSVSDLIFVAFLGLLTLTPLSRRLLGDAGIGWHIRTGQQILATHAIPRVDSFSSTMSGKPWFAWEWLYDLAVGALHGWAGLNGVVLLTAVVIAVIFAATFRLLVRRGTNLILALVLVLLAASASMIHFQARPHVASWLFTLVWFWILDSSERSCFEDGKESHGRVWMLPGLMLVWVNVHGGFLIGFVLLAIYWLSAVWRWYVSRESVFVEFLQRVRFGRRAWHLVSVGVAAALATLVNPYGWKLHEHIYGYLSSRFLMDHINEFQSPNFHGVAERCFAALMLTALVALAVRTRQVRLSEGLVIVFAVYAGLYASRNIPVSSILLALVTGPMIAGTGKKFWERTRWLRGRGAVELRSAGQPLRLRSGQAWAAVPTFSTRMLALESSLQGHVWALVAVVVACVVAGHGGRVGSRLVMDARFDPARFPVKAVDYLEEHGVAGPVLSPDFWGGYLIYRMYPKVQVVADDRHDLYGEQFFKNYLKVIEVRPGWEAFLREHRARSVLLPKGSALANVLREMEGWKVIYSDDVAAAFVPGG
jgi:hypothetical protein